MRSKEQIEASIKITEADFDDKRSRRDWHGTMDCSADLRELEMELRCAIEQATRLEACLRELERREDNARME
jgi:hypothetical protein